jgi:hypothetical protein
MGPNPASSGVASRWTRFIPLDRVAHGYIPDEAGGYRSLCGRRTVRADNPPFRASASVSAEDPEVPTPDDPSGCCLRCWARSFPATRTARGALRKRPPATSGG